MRCC
ncbi:unnamed protein product, partial [Didymodactylos carnosus]